MNKLHTINAEDLQKQDIWEPTFLPFLVDELIPEGLASPPRAYRRSASWLAFVALLVRCTQGQAALLNLVHNAG